MIDEPVINRQEKLEDLNLRMGGMLIANALLASLLALITAGAIAAVYAMTRAGFMSGVPAIQLLWVAIATLLVAAGYVVAVRLARESLGIGGQVAVVAFGAAFCVAVVLFWQGIGLILISIAWAQTIAAAVLGMRGRALLRPVAISVIATLAIWGLDSALSYPRLQVTSLAENISLGFLITMAVVHFITAIISNPFWFKRLQNRLILTSIFSIAAPLIATSVVFGINGYTSAQEQINSSLLTVSSLKERQIDQLIDAFEEDILRIEVDFELYNSIQLLLGGTLQDRLEVSRNRTVALARLHAIQDSEEESYREIWVLDTDGTVVLSTNAEDEGLSFNGYPFFENGRAGFSVYIPAEAPFERQEIVVVKPILEPRTNRLLGLLALRADSELVRSIMGETPGLPLANTYMLAVDFSPITGLEANPSDSERNRVRGAVLSGRQADDGIYAEFPNYAGEAVLAYVRWYQPLQIMMVAETPQSFVFQSLFSSIIASVLAGLFGVAVTLVAIMISARSISEPIRDLDRSAQSVAAGDLSVRAELSRTDEIGSLTKSFNAMADRLKFMIGSLEQRVTDRTEELERQTLRLRTAAEIARDAASAQNLDELLNRAASLIRDRFNFYHTGIFLLDNNNEYAVLRASPTDAGQQMLANRHQLKVGEVGIVGYVASTGQPRIALDTDQDVTFFDNPLLPKTRSEMALPLVADNIVIGVLDVQSDQPQAFSQEDIAIMQVLADLVATAIEKTRLLSELQDNVRELERAGQEYTRQSWREIGGQKGVTGYHYDKNRLALASELPQSAAVALQTGSVSFSGDEAAGDEGTRSAAIPVKLRGLTIGVLDLKFKGDRIPDETVRLIEAIADRLAIAVENARLVQDSQRRASLEYTISQMSNRIGSATEIDAVLKSTALELGKLLSDTKVSVKLINSSNGSNGAQEKLTK